MDKNTETTQSDVIIIPKQMKLNKSQFVQYYLEQTRSAYVKELYDAWCAFRRQIGKSGGSYASFRVLVNKIKGDIITLDHIEPSPKGYPKHYYRLKRK